MSETRTPLVAARDISLRFHDRAGVENVSISIAPGEIVTLIGPNGAGKSTVVRMLLGLVEPESGSVTRKPGLKVGYVPQRLSADPSLPMTVTRFLKTGNPQASAATAVALSEVGADHLANAQLNELSGGELQRVYLARALLRDPELLVLDEPTQSVDFTGQIELYALIADIRKRRGCGILIISHDLHLVMSKTDHVVCLNRHVCCEGQPEAVSRHPEYQALFGPSGAEGLAVYSHHHDHAHGLSGDVDHEHGHDHAHAHGHDHTHGHGGPHHD
jgi:zinc transport system ATP-binding protein